MFGNECSPRFPRRRLGRRCLTPPTLPPAHPPRLFTIYLPSPLSPQTNHPRAHTSTEWNSARTTEPKLELERTAERSSAGIVERTVEHASERFPEQSSEWFSERSSAGIHRGTDCGTSHGTDLGIVPPNGPWNLPWNGRGLGKIWDGFIC